MEEDKENMDPNAATKQHLISVLQSSRKRKPFENCRSTQKRMRINDVKAFASVTDTPLFALRPTRIPPANLVHLPTSTRRSMRAVDGLRMASEKRIKDCKLMLAQEFGTETATIASTAVEGAYITDPIYFIELITRYSPFICIGGDCGGGVTKLGITYLNERKKATFSAMLVYSASDHYESVSKLVQPVLTPFKSRSRISGPSPACHLPHSSSTVSNHHTNQSSYYFSPSLCCKQGLLALSCRVNERVSCDDDA